MRSIDPAEFTENQRSSYLICPLFFDTSPIYLPIERSILYESRKINPVFDRQPYSTINFRRISLDERKG